MALVLRTEHGTRLSWLQMDNNLRYLEETMTDHDHAYEPVISPKNTAFTPLILKKTQMAFH
jgi:hypothetical protein